jgi:cytochrome c oxidase subunit IV
VSHADALRRIRRGVGVVLIAGGLLHAGQNLFACLWSTGRLRLPVSPRLWVHLAFGQFLFLVLAGLGYLISAFQRERYFYYEALVDYLIGVAGLLIVMPFVSTAIVDRVLPVWASLLPGVLLIVYGAGLCAGRAYGWQKTPSPPAA